MNKTSYSKIGILGLSLLAQQAWSAETLIPTTSATIESIKQAYHKKQYSDAIKQSQDYLNSFPKDVDAMLYQGLAYTKQAQCKNAIPVFKKILEITPNYTDAQDALNQCQKKHVSSRTVKKTTFTIVNKPKLAHKQRPMILRAMNLAQNIPLYREAGQPNYVAGIFTDNMLVNVPDQSWNLSNLYAYKVTPMGSYGLSVNYANRYNLQATQLELNAIPKISKSVYLDLAYGYANKPELFPDQLERGEVYLMLPQDIETSIGGAHRDIAQYRLNSMTGTLAKYINRYYVNIRPTYFVPGSGPTSLFYRVLLRRYGDTEGQYLGLVVGSGYTPDLTDLLTVDFIKVKDRLILLEGQQPITKNLAFQYGVGYEDMRYPNNFLRTLVHINLGLKAGFL